MNLRDRAERHAALGDERRLQIVDELAVGDRTVAQLGDLAELQGNLLAHHLDVLDNAGLIERRVSEGDRRRRYVSLRWEDLPPAVNHRLRQPANVAFVCSHNSARSQFAAALWETATGSNTSSAGTEPADRVHPTAVHVAAEFGIDISGGTPSGYDSLPDDPDLIITVCDRANESTVPVARQRLHWSVPDPVQDGTLRAFRSAFHEIARRVEYFTRARTS